MAQTAAIVGHNSGTSSTRRVADAVVVVDGFAWGDLFDRMRKISKKRRVSNTEMFVINYFFIGRT